MEPVVAPRTFQGRYEVTHLIARGGMAQVYRAHDLRLGRFVALKVLFPELSVDRTFVERFRREAQAAANLSHPNIVAVYDWGEEDGTYYIVMELNSRDEALIGRSLATELRAEKTLPATRAATIAAQVANALAYAHRHGVVHRDIKPGNVLLTDDGQVKVTDFGIAQAVSTEEGLTMAGSVMGTAAYFSPEQAEGALVDGRSDVYSLGVVLFEMLAGRPPFVGDSPVAVASMHVRNAPPALRDLNPAVPEAIDAVTMRALRKAPADRYQTAEEFREDLLRFCDGRPVLAQSPVAAGVGSTSVIGIGETSVVGGVGAGVPVGDTTIVVPAVAPASAVAAAPVAVPSEARMDGPVHDVATNKRSTRNGVLVAVAILVVLLVVGIVVALDLARPKTLTMPNVVNRSLTYAVDTLHAEGLKVVATTARIDAGVQRGHVISTNPPAGKALKPGAHVSIVYSRGKVINIKVPPVARLGVVAAENALSAVGLSYKTVPVPSWTAPVIPGSVLAQFPVAGTTVESTYVVVLKVLGSGGTYPVPNVSGDAQVTAGSTLGQYGLTAGTSMSVCSSSETSGNVVSTTPAANSPVQAGAVINLTVSTGPCPVTVPNVVTLDYQQAYTSIHVAGLNPDIVETCGSGDTPTGFIVSQSPLALTSVPPGTLVNAYTGCSTTTTTTTSTLSANLGDGSIPLMPSAWTPVVWRRRGG
jgi:eukaryotic-like serine/threonine-protein kinase